MSACLQLMMSDEDFAATLLTMSQSELRDEAIRKSAAHHELTIRTMLSLHVMGMPQPQLWAELAEVLAEGGTLEQFVIDTAHAEAVKHVERLEFLAAFERRTDKHEFTRHA